MLIYVRASVDGRRLMSSVSSDWRFVVSVLFLVCLLSLLRWQRLAVWRTQFNRAPWCQDLGCTNPTCCEL